MRKWILALALLATVAGGIAMAMAPVSASACTTSDCYKEK